MSVTGSVKSDFKVAVLTGAGKIEEAILELKKSLTGTGDDVYILSLIADFYYHSDRPKKAIEYADKVIAIDEKNFDANALLAMIYANLKDHEFALCYIRVALENFPEPMPAPPKFMLRIVSLVGFIFGKPKHWAKKLEAEASNPNRSRQEWLDWATKYMRWYYNDELAPFALSKN